MRINILQTEKNLSLPPICACCGDPADTTARVGATETVGRLRKTVAWQFPHCRTCAQHVAASEPSSAGLIVLVKFLLLIGTLFIGFYLIDKFVLEPRRMAAARAMCKPGCGDAARIRCTFAYPVDANKKGHAAFAFDIRCQRFAQLFVKANRARITCPDSEVLALLQESAGTQAAG